MIVEDVFGEGDVLKGHSKKRAFIYHREKK
jgi:hypothetical protein